MNASNLKMPNLNKLKVVFFGTSEFAVPILALIAESAELVGIVTQPDRPVGRHQEMQRPPVLQKFDAVDPDLHILQFETLKDPSVIEELKSLNADMFIVAAYGKIIPQAILDIPPMGCINVHGSRLPQYRGASPIHQVLRDGLKTTGNTIMFMDAKMDTGPILSMSEVEILPEDDFKSLEAKMSEDGAKQLIETLVKLLDGSIKPVEQDNDQATYCKILTKEDGLIDWSQSSEQIFNQYRALKYWPGVFSYVTVKDKLLRIKFEQISRSPDKVEQGAIQIIDSRLLVGAGDGSIEVQQLTLEGKKSMTAKEFINGYKELDGAQLKNR